MIGRRGVTKRIGIELALHDEIERLRRREYSGWGFEKIRFFERVKTSRGRT